MAGSHSAEKHAPDEYLKSDCDEDHAPDNPGAPGDLFAEILPERKAGRAGAQLHRPAGQPKNL